MAKKFFEKSEKWKEEYCCSIVRVGEIIPIEGSDFLGKTLVEGFTIVVRKDEVKEGDVLVYAENETMLNKEFLSKNNLFELSERELNDNYKEVQALMYDGKEDEAKKLVGFFNKHGRVKMITLRKCPSMGFLFGKSALVNWKKEFEDVNLEDYVGEDFDTVLGELFVQAYVPLQNKQTSERKSKGERRSKKLERFDKIIPGEFQYHYDTSQLNKNIHRFEPDTNVTISLKKHGTSGIFGNVKLRMPKKIEWYKRFVNFVFKFVGAEKPFIDYNVEYGPIYSSRSVIKNQYINKNVGDGFYKVDVWTEYGEMLKDIIPQGYTVYGEICGYLTDSNSMIQKGYDYGCEVGKNFLMPYRITIEDENGGKKKELNVSEVDEWTNKVLSEHPELEGKLQPMTVFYNGTLRDLYPNLDVANHWHENVLEAMKNDAEHFGMEGYETLCKNKVYREGICVRINDDPISECFKLKCLNFLNDESKNIDKNVDIEMSETNY